MKCSDVLNELTAALAKAAAKFPPIERGCTARVATKSGGQYSYDYADLDDVLRAVRGPLAENGLTLIHDSVVKHDPLGVETTAILMHSSGQRLESSPLFIPCDGMMSAAQLIGSGSTYGRRYTTQAILGISTERDDDGNIAGGNHADTARREPRKDVPSVKCEKCGGPMWDNRAENDAREARGEKRRPDFTCKDKTGCGAVVWQQKTEDEHNRPAPPAKETNGHADTGCITVEQAHALHAEVVRYKKTPQDFMAVFSEFGVDKKYTQLKAADLPKAEAWLKNDPNWRNAGRISSQDADALMEAAAAAEVGSDIICAEFAVSSVYELPSVHLEAAKALIEKNKKKAKAKKAGTTA